MSGDMLHSFGVNKVEKLKRTKIRFDMRNTCEQRQGALVPLCWHMVTPSEVWECKTNVMSRLLLPLANPVFGDIYGTYCWVFVPFRILFKDYEKIFGDGQPEEWINPTEWVVPKVPFLISNVTRDTSPAIVGYDAIVPDSGSFDANGNIISKPGNLANYCGLPPTKVKNGDAVQFNVNCAPMLTYLKAWNDLFRDENYQEEDPDISIFKNFTPGSVGARPNLRFCLHYANRFHDYFSSLLPNTQKGPDVLAFSHLVALDDLYDLVRRGSGDYPEDVNIKFGNAGLQALSNATLALNSNGNMATLTGGSVAGNDVIHSTNLGVEISIDQIRDAFALKRATERNARTGSRYTEALLGTYEAHLPSAVAQKTEYLGGNSFRLNVTSVPKTASDDVGKLGAFSATFDGQTAFRKQFNEPGIVMCLLTYRIKHRYCQGIDRQFAKFRRYDWYDPAFAHVSEQPHYAWELSPLHHGGDLDDVVGFNEPWVEDIRPIDRVTGLMGDVYGAGWNTYKQWTFVDEFDTVNGSINPKAWLPESGDEVSKRLVGYNSDYPTWVFGTDILAECKVTGPRPLYTIPGYIDHLIA